MWTNIKGTDLSLKSQKHVSEYLKYRNISVAVNHVYQKILLISFFSRPQRAESLGSHKEQFFLQTACSRNVKSRVGLKQWLKTSFYFYMTFLLDEEISSLCNTSTHVRYSQCYKFLNWYHLFLASPNGKAKLCSITSELYEHYFSIHLAMQTEYWPSSAARKPLQKSLWKKNTVVLNASWITGKEGKPHCARTCAAYDSTATTPSATGHQHHSKGIHQGCVEEYEQEEDKLVALSDFQPPFSSYYCVPLSETLIKKVLSLHVTRETNKRAWGRF